MRQAARARSIAHALDEAVEGPEQDVAGVAGRGREHEVEGGSQEHCHRDVFAGVATVGEVAHDELADAIGNGGASENVADHGLVVVKGRTEFLGNGREIIADDVKGGVGDEGRLKDPPPVGRIESINLRRWE